MKAFLLILSLTPVMFWWNVACARIELVVSVAPLKHFAERVGGEHVAVQSMVQPGHSPLTYDPTPRQMAGLAAARAYFRVGVPFENSWMDRIRAANPDLDIIDVRTGVDLIPVPGSGDEDSPRHGHDHGDMDPHIWLDPGIAAHITKTIRDYLIRIDPGSGNEYRENTDRFLSELSDLDREVRSLVEQGGSRKFLVFHPAWGYFARAYGLEQIAVEHEGKEPGPRSLALLLEMAAGEGIESIFVQEQFSSRTAEALAAGIGADVVSLDPLAEDYVANLLGAARAISGLPR